MQTKRTKRSFLTAMGGRLILGLLALAILGGMLTSCGGGAATTSTLTRVDITISAEQASEHTLDAAAINRLTQVIVDQSNAADIRTKLVAALNGYDMTVSGFDDANLGEAKPAEAATFAYNVLDKANLNGAQNKDKSITLDLNSYKDMTLADVQSIVDAFKTTVVVDAQRDFLHSILFFIGVAFNWLIQVPGFGMFILGALYFAVLVEIIMLPISIIQQKNSRKQATLRPKEMAIRNKYAGRKDPATQQKITAEIQELYQKEGYNPMSSGCLPLLISMPIILALYYVVIDPLLYILGCSSELSSALTAFAAAPRAAGGLGMTLASQRGSIEILARLEELPLGLKDFQFFSNGESCYNALEAVWDKVPNFELFGMNFGLTPGFAAETAWLLVIPVLTFVVYFFSMKINRKLSYQPTMNADDKAAGCSNNIMDWTMPLISVWVTFVVPAAVGLYWIFKSVVGVVKQFVMSKAMPMPTFTEEDYKAAIRELQGKEKAKPQKKSGTRNPNVRSLHHIDDEDYEPEAVRAEKAKAAPAKEESPAPAGEAHPMIDRPALKEDRPAKNETTDETTTENTESAPSAESQDTDGTDA